MPTRFELVIKVLQTFALPLGYGTIFLNDSDGNRTRVTAVKGRCLNLLTTEPNTSGSTLLTEEPETVFLSASSRARTCNTAVNSRVLYH